MNAASAGLWVLGRHRAEGHTHDGVGACGEHVHAAITNERAGVVPDLVGEGKTHPLGLANPVFLHQLDTLWPARHAVTGHIGQQFFSVIGDLEVITRNLALLNRSARAPTLAVNHLSQLTIWVLR
ncbi:MAG: hypothetical protein RLZZ371_771 [Pseudomonadota bacterium]